VDLVLHSATKGIAGHNDATLGVVAGSEELIDWLWSFAVLQGAVASPFDALNGLRGHAHPSGAAPSAVRDGACTWRTANCSAIRPST
jgi:hypothetical protein